MPVAHRKKPASKASGGHPRRRTETHVAAPGNSTVEKRPVAFPPQASASYSGPLPPPSLFRQYQDILPDAPERILRVFEEDSRHIREIQFAGLNAQREDNRRVHWMAFGLILAGFALSGVFAYLDKDWLAGITLGTTLTGTISGFLSGRSNRDGSAR